VEQAGRCRLVVTGAYHVAVFAMAQGIPAICLAKSAYFTDKLRGLADMFEPGCEVIDMAAPEWDRDLLTAMQRMWERAEELRPGLLRAAEAQNRAGLDVVRSLRELVRPSAPRHEGRMESEVLRARSARPAARSHG
jgi:polysaccharide pyruvyl transferase WcaK-like protein